MSSENKPETKEDPKELKQEEPEKKNICALEYNIKNKGENSYYYAHKARFEPETGDPNAIKIKGPGIITGGTPELLLTEKRKIVEEKKPKAISSYQFYDDDKTAVVKIELQKDAEDALEEGITVDFQKRSFNMSIKTPQGNTFIFKVDKLFMDIVPEKSGYKLFTNKQGKKIIKISFYKMDIDEEWTKLYDDKSNKED